VARWKTLPLLLLLCSCSKPIPKTVLRTLSGPDPGGAMRGIIYEFERLNPDIRVECVEGPASTDEREALYAASFQAQGGVSYDVLQMDIIWVPRFASQGWLRPLDDFFRLAEQGQFLPGDIVGSRYRGRIYRVPVQSDGGLLYYRKDLLKEAGIEPPRTFQELSEAAARLQKPPLLWGYVFQGKPYEGLVCNFLEAVWGQGGVFLGPDNEVRIDGRPAVAALEWMRALVRDGLAPAEVLSFDEEDARRMFQDGRAVFMRNWPYAWSLLHEDRSSVKGRVGVVPMVRGPGRGPCAALGGWGFGISAASKHPEAAWRFIQFVASPEGQKIAYMTGGIVPTRKELFLDPDIVRKSPHYPELFEVLSRAKLRPRHPAYGRMSKALQVRLGAALAGKEKPEAALKAAAAEIRGILKN